MHAAAEVVAQDEKLYEEYLAARLGQVEEEFRAARIALATDPGDTLKAAQTLLAEQALMAARADLKAQQAKTGSMIRLVQRTQSAGLNGRSHNIKPSHPLARPATHVTPSTPTKIDTARPVRPVATRPDTTAVSTKPAYGNKPNENFRTVQAIKARQALLKARQALDEAMHHAPVSARTTPSDHRHPGFGTTQSIAPRKIALQPKQRTDIKECPNCTASMALSVTRCGCGFDFPVGGPDLPGLPLTTKDLTILAKETRFFRINKRG